MRFGNSRAPGRWLVFLLVLLRLPLALFRRPPTHPRHILVLHHLLLGDTLMLTPLLAKLRARYPHATLRMACPRAFVPLYAGQPYGVQAQFFDPRDVRTLLPFLRLPRPDLVLLPADNRYSWLARALGARWIVGFAGDKPAWKNWGVDDLRLYSPQPTAWGDTCAELVDGPRPPQYRPADWPTPPARPLPEVIPGSPSWSGLPYVVLHLGASSPLKLWDATRWQALAEGLEAQGHAVVWSAGPGEAHLVAACDPAGRYCNLAGQLDLPQLWHLLAGAALLVCPDTGVAHLGRLVGVPTLTLFGPGSALLCGPGDFWANSPYRAVTVAAFPCRDQFIQYQRHIPWVQRCERFPGPAPARCPQARCMAGIALADVKAAAAELLAWREASA